MTADRALARQRGQDELRRHDAEPLASWANSQHAQGLCESWIEDGLVPPHACRNRATATVWSPGRTLLLHLCGVHLKPYIVAIAHQSRGERSVYLRRSRKPLPDDLKWRSIGGW